MKIQVRSIACLCSTTDPVTLLDSVHRTMVALHWYRLMIDRLITLIFNMEDAGQREVHKA